MAHNKIREGKVVHQINSLLQLISHIWELLRALFYELNIQCTYSTSEEKFKGVYVESQNTAAVGCDRIRSDFQPSTITEQGRAVGCGLWGLELLCLPSASCLLYFMRSIRWDDPIDTATPTPITILNAPRLLNTQTIRETQGTRSVVSRQLQVEKGDINLTYLNPFDSL